MNDPLIAITVEQNAVCIAAVHLEHFWISHVAGFLSHANGTLGGVVRPKVIDTVLDEKTVCFPRGIVLQELILEIFLTRRNLQWPSRRNLKILVDLYNLVVVHIDEL